ncbi:MAG TPA: type II secretion system protein GspM [Usitatibacter sp.]|nr:type II secretion system protein GspM [Usitatibacter sp.]
MTHDQSRRLAIGLLFLAIAAVIAAIGVPAWMLHKRYDVALDDGLGKLERYRRIAGTRPEVARELQAMHTKEPRKFFLRSGAVALSAAEAQEAVRNIVESNGGKLITMQAPVSREEGRYRMVSVNVQLTANIFALRKILDAIDANTPFLFIDNLMVRSQVPGSFRPQPGQEPEMFVQFDVYGYSLTAAS